MNIIEGIEEVLLFSNYKQIYTKLTGFVAYTNNNQQLYKVKAKKK